MQEKVMQPGSLQEPQEVENPIGGALYERYKKDGIYEYAKLPNGQKDKSRVKITYHRGTVYEGGINRGRYAGSGTYAWSDGSYYKGIFKNGKLNGNGTYTAANGDQYEGLFRKNRYEGRGTYIWSDGSKFAGTFKGGQILEGRYTDANGNVYLCHYTYKLNGRRKRGEVKLIKSANEGKTEEKKPSETASKKERLEKAGLLNRDLTMMTAIRKSVRGAEFKELYSGKAGKDEKSEKRLMAILNFFTNSNAEQMQRIFRSSKLYAEDKGQNYISELASGAIKNGQEFAKAIKTQMKNRQKGINAEKGATR